MPDFNAKIDLDADEFLDECSSGEIEDVIEWLIDNDHLKGTLLTPNSTSFDQTDFTQALNKLQMAYYQMPNHECQLIIDLAKKY
jgi:hypothetical protein